MVKHFILGGVLCVLLGIIVASAYTPITRTYFIAAEDVEWNYAPSNTVNLMTGQNFTDEQNVYVLNGADRIGHIYKKSLYFEYTDASFSTKKTRAAQWAHTGVLGPIIRGVVGDTIKVVFKNMASHPYSIHAHGVDYAKDSEGVDYNDGTQSVDGAIATGANYTYTWNVPVRAGPGPNDPSSIMWLYHSHTNEVVDTNTGLIGAILITSAAYAHDDCTPTDVDREFIVHFSVYDENLSYYLNENILSYTSVTEADIPDLVVDGDFIESNLKHNMNGFLFGNLVGLDMKTGERVRWYVGALGTEVDLHTPHWHGATLMHAGKRADVLSLLPAVTITADMIPDEVGQWMFHCHVNDHILAGMTTKYVITQGSATPPPDSISNAKKNGVLLASFGLTVFLAIVSYLV